MNYPNFNEEKKLWKRGINLVVGLDEAGRGPLAGPVVAGAVSVSKLNHSDFIRNSKFEILNLHINDSKKLSEKQREELYEILVNHTDITFGVGIVSEKIIDKINILQASKLAMQKALHQIEEKLQVRADFLLIDGNFKIVTDVLQRSIIKGDSKVFSIAAASIIAKVTRDNIMQKMHKKYPEYGFDKHKGYGTALHIKNLQQFGVSAIHRKSFYPVSSELRNSRLNLLKEFRNSELSDLSTY